MTAVSAEVTPSLAPRVGPPPGPAGYALECSVLAGLTVQPPQHLLLLETS